MDKLNALQHQLRAETNPIERERLRLSIEALTKAVRKSVYEHNLLMDKYMERRNNHELNRGAIQ
ncbi:hypothetical protein [Sporolactobacillus pectinivorans]|uniref:hypothetical protein n=1 Tax=Sporolactobacillus pectinivorans TaxID=1591408 RepID=UPI00138FB13A|nr:hypothetical protein [Sporolactobacillus pectinivorans]